jgi:hypothetical protein
MIDRSDEPNNRRLEGVISRELGIQYKESILIGRFFGSQQ